eukprot:scaffold663954_cov113-Prasinocladus_malaysianus.AAC.1
MPPHSHQFSIVYALIQIQFLIDLANNPEAALKANDGLVMIGPGTIIGRNLRPAFLSIGSAAGFVLTAPSGHALTSTVSSLEVAHPSEAGGKSLRNVGVDTSLW